MYQEMSDIIQSDLIKFDHQSLVKMAEKWPENGLLGPKMAIFEVLKFWPSWPFLALFGHFG